ncbi:hypothetical protein DPMN_109524 [Dreissena polymorpha]|uniref:Uncharacterized protein n=1 Tax=Dreissena polymorpha TaxID=45954 RepID=A0A9D4KAX1_DREPO|nr:hypothetical protein DPMN_109524 [Dreissena polymorpha]
MTSGSGPAMNSEIGPTGRAVDMAPVSFSMRLRLSFRTTCATSNLAASRRNGTGIALSPEQTKLKAKLLLSIT